MYVALCALFNAPAKICNLVPFDLQDRENVTLCSYCLVGLCVILNSFLETVYAINI